MLERPSPAEFDISSGRLAVEETEEQQGFDLREALSFAWRQWKFIVSIVALALLVTAVYVLTATPRYTASAYILLDAHPQKSPVAEVDERVALGIAELESQIAIIESMTFLRRVVQKTRLIDDPEFGSKPKPQYSSFYAKIRSYFSGSNGQTSVDSPSSPDSPTTNSASISDREMSSIRALKNAMSVNRPGKGYVLSVSVTSTDAQRSARLANAVANAYVVEKLDARFDAAKRASGWLSDRLGKLRDQVRQSEEAVADFRTKHGLTESAPNVALSQEELSQLSAKLVQARTDLAQKKARLDVVHSIIQKGGSIQSLPDLPDSSMLASLRAQEATISQKEADLESRYNARHPLVVNIRAQHRDIERQISAELKRLAGNVEDDYQLAKARVAALQDALGEATGQDGSGDKTAMTLHELERTAAINKSLFDNFLQKAKITQQEATFEAQYARVITPAVRPANPSYPKKLRTIMVAAVIGLMLGVGGAVAREKLNSGFMTPRQVETLLELPVLASVFRVKVGELSSNGRPVAIPNCPASIPLCRYSEAIRSLRSGIHMTDVDDPPKVVQVTSTVPSEGKTTIGLSIAVSAAASGKKVIFIDADLRRPSASKFLGMEDDPGLVDLLLGTGKASDVIKYNEIVKFWQIGVGSKTNNPTDLLSSERMKGFVQQCRQSFDLVVIDTPPVGPVIDPVVVSHLADKVVFVVHWGSTPREVVQQAVHRIPGHRKVAGIVLNMVDGKTAQKYGKDAYGYYYSGREYDNYYSS